MSTKKTLFQFRDTVKEISLGDKVVITHVNRKHIPPQEFTISKIGRKYVTFTMAEGKFTYGEIQFDFEGRENSDYHQHTIYSSLSAYEQTIIDNKARSIFYKLVQRNDKFREDQIKKAAYALNIFGEYLEEMKK